MQCSCSQASFDGLHDEGVYAWRMLPTAGYREVHVRQLPFRALLLKQTKEANHSEQEVHCGGAHDYKRCADLAKIFQETSSLGALVAQEEGGAGEGA